MLKELLQLLKSQSKENLVKIYHFIEPRILDELDEEKEKIAMNDIKHGRVQSFDSVDKLLKACSKS